MTQKQNISISRDALRSLRRLRVSCTSTSVLLEHGTGLCPQWSAGCTLAVASDPSGTLLPRRGQTHQPRRPLPEGYTPRPRTSHNKSLTPHSTPNCVSSRDRTGQELREIILPNVEEGRSRRRGDKEENNIDYPTAIAIKRQRRRRHG